MIFGAFAASTLELLAYSPPGWGATLLRGLGNSVVIALGAYGLGMVIGVAGAYGKLYGGAITKDLLAVYTTVVRAVPELVLILILYFAVTDLVNTVLQGWGYSRIQISGIAAGIAVLGIVQGAYSIEVLRGAILAVRSDRGGQGHGRARRSFGPSYHPAPDDGQCRARPCQPVAHRDQGHRPFGRGGFCRVDTGHTTGRWHNQGLFDLFRSGGRVVSVAVVDLDGDLQPH